MKCALAGEVRAVADPDRQRLRADRLADLDALEVVLDRLRADRGVGVAERAELVGERLAGRVGEGVRVHRVEAEPELLAPSAFSAARVGLVPRDVQRDRRRRAGQPLDDGAVVELVEDVARLARPGEAREAGAAGADAPGGHGDAEGRDLGLDPRRCRCRGRRAARRARRSRARAPCGAARCRPRSRRRSIVRPCDAPIG